MCQCQPHTLPLQRRVKVAPANAKGDHEKMSAFPKPGAGDPGASSSASVAVAPSLKRTRLAALAGAASPAPAPAARRHRSSPSCLGRDAYVEPLKVCLDDDSSLEDDGDGDCLFGDDAFALCDEDFTALLSHGALRGASAMTSSAANAAASTASSAVDASSAAISSAVDAASAAISSAADAASATTSSTVDAAMPSTAISSTASLASQDASAASQKAARSRRRVSLHADVAVVPIPPRDAYPPSVRARLWGSAAEIQRNAARNALEFAAEGFAWRDAVDDAGMVVVGDGEKVHPVHVLHAAAVAACRDAALASARRAAAEACPGAEAAGARAGRLPLPVRGGGASAGQRPV